ncbi:tyrosine-type recombinase/integrase [Paenibacillus terrigena]|uniref:tyrosine-type recombinase/integrase n=1 Tax=Paenibacillus terrigena TaxID=369333 RepID=UPI00059319E9|nr:tyrosine-type recombinase/integrase [Paenibacillus terrigena]
MEVDLFIKDQEARGKSDNTVSTYRRIMMSFVEWLDTNGGDITDLTRYDVQSYIKSLEQDGKNASTIDKIFACLSVYARYTDHHDIVDRIKRTKPQRQTQTAPKSLGELERKALLRDVEKDRNLRDIAIIYTLVHCGLRVSELVALDISDIVIYERSGNLTVRYSKGGESRVVPLAVDVRYHLTRYLDTRTDNDIALFLSNERKRISVRTIQHMLSKYGTHPHALRHTFVRQLVKSGNDISTVAELAGHRDVNVTRRYSKPDEMEKIAAIEKAFS